MMQPPRIAGGILATVLAAALFFVVVGICALFQGGVMSYLGFEYESVGAFFLFFFLGYLICTPFDFIVEAIPVALFKIGVLKNEEGVGFYALHTAADALFTAGCLAVVDAFMDSASASWGGACRLFAGACGCRFVDRLPLHEAVVRCGRDERK